VTAALPALAKLRPNPQWAKLPLFDRKGWKIVRFGEVVENLNETCDPEEAGLERFIGMEHLEPGSLHIREWGNVADGTTFTRRCRLGQVLFGKRRAYQRKVAVAEFDAVVSGDIYVLAPKGDRLLPELVPFLCLSERFFQHAVGTSAGSLSPRTNWSSLASFEFALPPLDQQRRIAEILWAVDEAVQKNEALCDAVARAVQTTAMDTVFPFGYSPASRDLDSRYNKGFAARRATDLYEVFSGNGEPSTSGGGQVLYFKVNDFNLNAEEVSLEKGATRFDAKWNEGIRVLPLGTVVFPKRGASIFLNKVGIARRPLALDPNLMGLVPKEETIRGEYLYWLIKLTQIGRIADTTSLPQLNHKHLVPLVFPVPPLDAQDAFLHRVQELRMAQAASHAQADALREVQKAFTNTFIAP
jgi:type I restriction enzyme S subunit